MKFNRVMAIIRRHVIQMFKDLDRFFDLVYWPLIDIILWGFTSLWFVQSTNHQPNYGFILICSIALWEVIYRTSVDISINVIEELWSKNLVNLFSSPLRVSEWMVGMMILSLSRALIVFFYTALLVWYIYAWNIFSIGYMLFAYVPLLILSGWALGFFVASLLIYYGQRFQVFVWAIGWLFAIIGTAFFPLTILPRWMQIICKSFPMAYVFEAMRIQVESKIYLWTNLYWALGLNLIYLTLALLCFKYMFNRSRNVGSAQIET